MQQALEVDHHGQAIRGMVYRPDKPGRHPCVLLLHSFTGDRIENGFLFVKLARELAGRGIATVAFDFLNSGESDGSFDQMLPSGELADTLRLFQWVQGQPYVDRSRIGIVGYSLGGLIASCASASLPSLRSLALIAPTTAGNLCRRSGDPDTCVPVKQPVVVGPHNLHLRFFEDLRSLDPIPQLLRHPRPTLVIQGMGDTAVPPSISQEYVDALTRAKVPHQVHQIPEAEHNFIRQAWQKSLVEAVVEWMEKTL